jgi:DNA-binding FadR family transcriptional regulator
LAARLRQRIARGDLRSGDTLPGESELTQQFGVSRPILREAFRILESECLIEVRRGVAGGARVCLPDPRMVARYAALILQVQGTTLADVHAARAAIEPAAARIFAERHSDEALRALRACHEDELRTSNDVRARAEASARFHSTLVELSGNSTLALLIGMLSTIIDHHNAIFAARLSREWQGYRGAYVHVIVEGHARLLQLVERGQGEAAEKFWQRHMHEAGDAVRALTGEDGASTLVDLLSSTNDGQR